MNKNKINWIIIAGILGLLRGMEGYAQQPVTGILEETDSLVNDTVCVDSVLTRAEPAMQWPFYMTSRLDTLIRKSPVMRQATLGMMVYDATADSVLFSYNEKKLLRPASTEKLITGITALYRLGASYPFRTLLYHTGEIRTDTVLLRDCRGEVLMDTVMMRPFARLRRVLTGDLYAKGAFDPMFSQADLDEFADAVQRLGIDSISGNFYEDVSLKDTVRWGKGWCWDDDNPMLSPLLVDRRQSFMFRLREALGSRGIACSGGIGQAVCPPEVKLIVGKERTLNQVMQRMMKRSDNLYAEAVFYQLGALSGRLYATASESEDVISQLIRELGYDPEVYHIVDGSGLSHYNNVSAELEVAFLQHARRQSSVFQPLYESLPIAGVDGTLNNRMKDLPAFRNVRAKTGTLNGVITLSGYATAANGHELIFAILLNGIRSSSAARAFQDDLCVVMTHDESPVVEKKRVVVQKRRRVVRRHTSYRKKHKSTTRRRKGK